MHFITTNTRQKHTGFTLVELVIVIVLLGILSVGISGFLSMGTQIFVDVKNRSALISTARFAIERVNRDIRSAVPNSLIVTANEVTTDEYRQCIEFTPIVAVTSYLDIPALPGEGASKSLRLIDFGDDIRAQMEGNNLSVVVYPLNSEELYNASASKIRVLNNATFDISKDPEWIVSFSNLVLFEQDSPTGNIFFIDSAVSYCVYNQELRRYVGGNPNNGSTSFGVLMANNLLTLEAGIVFPFELTNSAQRRNSTVLFLLQLEKNGETIIFNNEIHIPNAP